MASSLAEKIEQHFLQCGICLESFKNPRALPCLHAFCEECLERWYQTNKEEIPEVLICPNCSCQAEIPSEGIKGFPAHFMAKGLQETVTMEKTKEDYSNKLCTKCNTPDKKATVYCLDCKHYLCESCLDVHRSWDIMKHHRVVMVEDLTSGKVAISDTDLQDQSCAEHDGEHIRFYCETCGKPVCRDCIALKQCCRDHDTIPLKQASAMQISHIKESIKTCREKKSVCQDALEKSKLVTENLSSSAVKVRDTLAQMKGSFYQEIDEIFGSHDSTIENLCRVRTVKLTKDTDNLKEKMNQIDSTLELGVNLTESGSPYDIVSNYTSVLSSLQQVKDIQVNEVDGTLADIPTPVVECVLGIKQWEQSGKFEVRCESRFLTGIASTSDGHIALCDGYKRVHVYSRSGEFKHTPPTEGLLRDVAITSNNEYVITTSSQCCQLYSSQCKLITEFQTCNANNEPSEAVAITIDKDGCIILGMEDKAISIHNPDGSVKSRFAIPYFPRSVAATSKQEIVVATDNNTLELLDYSGKSILTLDPPPDIKTWWPRYVCSSKRDEVFVVNRRDPKAIYKYAAGRVYMGCITTEVTDPRGIALSHDDKELFVTEHDAKLVKIFKRP